jgi:C-terminal processing protease CtpA/Prc
VIFQADPAESLKGPPLRSCGLSFRKTPAYWKVVGVIPGSPAAAAGVKVGDLVTRIEGEAASAWEPERYERLLRSSARIEYTFSDGTREFPRALAVADIVP